MVAGPWSIAVIGNGTVGRTGVGFATSVGFATGVGFVTGVSSAVIMFHAVRRGCMVVNPGLGSASILNNGGPVSTGACGGRLVARRGVAVIQGA